ncbi:paralemmin-1-like isoform X2 [Sinocyclocheilus rhinocerous]|uniref:paralemmin-1-like isoform X2 n=1 Tax=Sinocyclocheilus rhinocerous TaxID=307959 RepID=UPI0007BA662D|nr:PREDICTED: paralemmin-1-like isoform X2 [Sinocyclocheilus rhinocerous]
MEMSESVSQQERLQAIAEKRKRQTEIENKKRQLEDDRRQLQHHKSKALRERWLMDGAPSAGPEEDGTTKQLREDEAKTRGLEETILRLERELEELETGVSATSTNLSDAVQEVNIKTVEKMIVMDSVTDSVKEVKVHVSPRLEKSGGVFDMMKAAMYSVEITVEKDLVTGETKVLSTNTLLPKDLSQQGVKVYEDEQKVVHEVRSVDGAVTNGVHQLSSSEVEELLHKADEVTMSESSKNTPRLERGQAEKVEKVEKVEKDVVPAAVPIKEITGVEAQPAAPQTEVGGASAENPVTMVFMGYQSVEDEDETKKVLGLESTTVKAEVVLIEDGDAKTAAGDAKQEQAPPNGSPAEPPKAEEAAGESGQTEEGAAEVKSKEKQPCKCCTIM